jgi:hypothetical protein
MKRGDTGLVGMVVGAILLVMLLALVWHFRNEETPSEKFAFKVRRLQLVDRMSRDLASASEAEKSAVMAVTDRDSQAYAEGARVAAAAVEKGRVELGELLRKGGRQKQSDLLEQFSRAFSDFRRVDDQLLDLAVKNTNLKASALAYGPASEALREMDAALSRLIAQSADSRAANAKKVMVLAAGAQAAALRIGMLLPPHIAEERDQKMDELEAQMEKEHSLALKNLKAMQELLPGNEDLERARSSYARFTETRKQILALSRENTNVRSLLLSLNEKRKVMIRCQDALAVLEQGIEEEPVPARLSPR